MLMPALVWIHPYKLCREEAAWSPAVPHANCKPRHHAMPAQCGCFQSAVDHTSWLLRGSSAGDCTVPQPANPSARQDWRAAAAGSPQHRLMVSIEAHRLAKDAAVASFQCHGAATMTMQLTASRAHRPCGGGWLQVKHVAHLLLEALQVLTVFKT